MGAEKVWQTISHFGQERHLMLQQQLSCPVSRKVLRENIELRRHAFASLPIFHRLKGKCCTVHHPLLSPAKLLRFFFDLRLNAIERTCQASKALVIGTLPKSQPERCQRHPGATIEFGTRCVPTPRYRMATTGRGILSIIDRYHLLDEEARTGG